MTTQQANAVWTGTLKEGNGRFELPKANVNGTFTFATRFEEENGTNPEELVAAAHASCFSMFLSALLTKNNFTPTTIGTTTSVTLGKDDQGPKITAISLEVSANVPAISESDFQGYVSEALEKCPISRLYAGTPKTVNATLLATV